MQEDGFSINSVPVTISRSGAQAGYEDPFSLSNHPRNFTPYCRSARIRSETDSAAWQTDHVCVKINLA